MPPSAWWTIPAIVVSVACLMVVLVAVYRLENDVNRRLDEHGRDKWRY